ncbi:hypothetical protein MTR67_016488 [Solanum verrucosum]|uniref:BAR domain-containing protein n=1 Tax=Solanum verrucosum TaxID=315347 RepID=A0AAF0QII8_SOLVR|nr:hypothetical protein MTR67_016488 [Solanum verrucosum]
MNHLFLHCKYTQQLWRICLNLKGISWTIPRKVSEALKSWEATEVEHVLVDRVSQFLSVDLRDVKESRRRFDKAASTYDQITLPVLFVINFTPELLNCQARERFSSLKKNARDEVVTELEEELHNSKSTFERSRFNLVNAITNVEAKKKYEFLESFSAIMDAHLRYFKLGHDLLSQMEPFIHQSIWDNRWMGEFLKEAIGSRGGIVVLWDERVWTGEMEEVGDQSITRKFTGVNEDFRWHITAVYADCNRVIKKTLWEELLAIRSRVLTDAEVLQKTNLAMEFDEVAKNEEIAWKERSRIQHVERVMVKDPVLINEAFQNFYMNLYKESEQWRPDLNILDVTVISEEEQTWFQRPFEEDEI